MRSISVAAPGLGVPASQAGNHEFAYSAIGAVGTPFFQVRSATPSTRKVTALRSRSIS